MKSKLLRFQPIATFVIMGNSQLHFILLSLSNYKLPFFYLLCTIDDDIYHCDSGIRRSFYLNSASVHVISVRIF
ncbi:hypothetical protein DSUL_20427 [Desulfovibrionales bacterium]